MFRKSSIKKFILVPAAVAVAAVLTLFASSSLVMADNQQDVTSAITKTDENGQTYGIGIVFDYGEEPDFIKAVASNGKEGYVKKDDLLKAEHMATTQEEALEATCERDKEIADAFSVELHKLSSASKIDDSTVDKILEFKLSGASSAPTSSANSAASILDSDGISLTESQIDTALANAIASLSTPIPVYDSDGKTVIGEFLVG